MIGFMLVFHLGVRQECFSLCVVQEPSQVRRVGWKASMPETKRDNMN